jgi:hypothetical protein
MNIEILGPKSLWDCKSLSSIRFESNSHLSQVESGAFSFLSLHAILIPSTVLLIPSDEVDIDFAIMLVDGDFCPELYR